MADILQNFPVKASLEEVFLAVSSPQGLDAWWTQRSSGRTENGATYELWFGPKHDWRAVVSRCVLNAEFELQLTVADDDWRGTRVGFRLDAAGALTQVRFHHTGWPRINEHYRTSCFCWAMYLRLLRRYLEQGEVVPYEQRLEA